MNRDEGKSTPTAQATLAHEIALGALPAEIVAASRVPEPGLQAQVDAAVSRATRSSRRWDRKALATACGAARPVVERDLRKQGRAFTRPDVKNAVRVQVSSYADRYGVALPPRVVLGKTALEAVAGDICGAFSLPWTSFLPPQVQLAAKAAQAGNPRAQSWLKKYFGHGSSPAPAPAPAAGTPAASPVLAAAKKEEAPASDDSGSSDSLGAFMHKLNPLYWLKSSEERDLIDKERQAWIDNAALQKKIEKRDVVLKQGEKTVEAKQAVEAARARGAEMETQLKSIQSQLSGACSGIQEIVGADRKPAPFDDDLADYDAAPVLKKVDKARQLNAANNAELKAAAAKLQSGSPLSPAETGQILLLLARNEQLHEFRKNLVSGLGYEKNPSAAQIQRHVVLGAVKAMTPAEQQMMAQIVTLSKQGNPNAVKALAALKAQGYAVTMGAAGPAAKIQGRALTLTEQQKLSQVVELAKAGNPNARRALEILRAQGQAVVVGGTMGFGVSDAWHIATLPIRGAISATNWTARKLGITKGGSASPEQVRLARLKAAANRRKAAQARARAADAQTEAEYRAIQATADAADAEADANEAEATAKEAAMMTAEAEYLPGQTTQADASDNSGAAKPVVTPLPDTPSVDNLKKLRRSVVAKKNPRAAAILAASEKNDPTGIKLRASMQLYKAALNKKSQERKAVAVMVAKAKKGDKQALADVQALKAASIAVKAERSAGRRVARAAAYRATTTKVKAAQKRLEVAASDQLIRASRRRQLVKVAKIESRAAAGDKKCQAVIKRQVAKAKAGDKGAKRAVAALALAKHVRTTAPNRREQKNLKAATKLVKRVGKGDKSALAQVHVYQAAAKHGNPNAKRAMKRVRTAAALEYAVKTGVIVLPAVVVTSEIAKKREQQKRLAAQKKVALAEKRLADGKATREVVLAAAKAAADGGDRAKGAELAAQAAALPSAGEELRRVAALSAAASAGSVPTQEKIARAEQAAAAGDPAGVAAMGSLAAVKALDQVSKGRPLDPEMKEAAHDVEAAQAGDQLAREKIASSQEQARAGIPAAVKYAVYAAGAAAVGRALADNPAAKDQWRQKAGLAPLSDENQDVKVVDAEVVSTPMSSLPDEPLPPVRGIWGLVKASLQAVGLATRDPFANYKEAVASRGRKTLPTTDNAGSGEVEPKFVKDMPGHYMMDKVTDDPRVSSDQSYLDIKMRQLVWLAQNGTDNATRTQARKEIDDFYPALKRREYWVAMVKKSRAGDPKAQSLVHEKMLSLNATDPHVTSPEVLEYRRAHNIPEGDAVQGSDIGSTMPPREQRIFDDALKNKTITRDDFELLASLETNPGETEKTLRGSGVKIVSFGPTSVRGEGKGKRDKKSEPSEIDALNELQDPSVRAAIEARRVKVATSSGEVTPKTAEFNAQRGRAQTTRDPGSPAVKPKKELSPDEEYQVHGEDKANKSPTSK